MICNRIIEYVILGKCVFVPFSFQVTLWLLSNNLSYLSSGWDLNIKYQQFLRLVYLKVHKKLGEIKERKNLVFNMWPNKKISGFEIICTLKNGQNHWYLLNISSFVLGLNRFKNQWIYKKGSGIYRLLLLYEFSMARFVKRNDKLSAHQRDLVKNIENINSEGNR